MNPLRVTLSWRAVALSLLTASLIAAVALLVSETIYPPLPQGRPTTGRVIVSLGFPAIGSGLFLLGALLVRAVPTLGAALLLGGAFVVVYGLRHLYGDGIIGDH